MAFHFTTLKISLRKTTLNEVSAFKVPWRTISVFVKGAATFDCAFEVKRTRPFFFYISCCTSFNSDQTLMNLTPSSLWPCMWWLCYRNTDRML